MAVTGKTYIRDTVTLQTTDSAANEIFSYTLPDDCTAFLTWRVHMREDSTPMQGFSFGNQTWYREAAGSAVQVGGGSANNINRFTDDGVVTEGESGSDIQLFVDGEGNTVEWVAFIELTIVETS